MFSWSSRARAEEAWGSLHYHFSGLQPFDSALLQTQRLKRRSLQHLATKRSARQGTSTTGGARCSHVLTFTKRWTDRAQAKRQSDSPDSEAGSGPFQQRLGKLRPKPARSCHGVSPQREGRGPSVKAMSPLQHPSRLKVYRPKPATTRSRESVSLQSGQLALP